MSAKQSKDESGDGQGAFAGLSMAQVVAGALASLTSLFLTEQVGIAGGVIGVIVSSIAYTVTSKVYGNMLARSGEKLRDRFGADEGADAAEARPAEPAHDPRAQAARRVAADEAVPEARTAAGGRIAPPTLRAQAAQRRQAEMRRRVLVVSVVAALAAVALSALAVTLLTAGRGLGPGVSRAAETATKAQTTQASTTKAATTHATTAQTGAATTAASTQQGAATGDSSSDAASTSKDGAATSSAGAAATSGSATTSEGTSSSGGSSASAADGAGASGGAAKASTAQTSASAGGTGATGSK